MQAQPVAARLQPAPDGAALRGVGVGSGHIGDQQPGDGQPFLDVREVIGDRGRNVPFGHQPQQPQAGIVVVVPGARTGRETARNEMRSAGILLCHRITSLAVRRLQKPSAQSLTLPLVFAYHEMAVHLLTVKPKRLLDRANSANDCN
jgi:hypothetical protein